MGDTYYRDGYKWGAPSGPTPNNGIYCVLGDSQVAGYNRWVMRWPDFLPMITNGGLAWDQFNKTTAQGGFQMAHIWDSGQNNLLDPWLKSIADHLIVALGTNDTPSVSWTAAQSRAFKKRLRSVVQLAQARRKIVTLVGTYYKTGVADSAVDECNSIIREVAQERGCGYADVVAAINASGLTPTQARMPSDGTHYGLGSYYVAEAVAEAVAKSAIINPFPLIDFEGDYSSATNTRGKVAAFNTSGSWGYGGSGTSATTSVTTNAAVVSSVSKGIITATTGNYWVQDVGLNNSYFTTGDWLLWTFKARLYNVTGGGDGSDTTKLVSIFPNWKTNLLNYNFAEMSAIALPVSSGGDTGFRAFASVFQVPAGISSLNKQLYCQLFGQTNPGSLAWSATMEFGDEYVWNLNTRSLVLGT